MIFTARNFGLVAALISVSACSVVATNQAGPDGCKSAGGDYGLALSKLQVSVEEDRDPDFPSAGQPQTSRLSSKIEDKVYRDDRATFCLDFLASFTSIDKLVVKKHKETQLLTEITVNTDDQLPEAVETLATGLSTLATPLRAGTAELPPLKFEDEFNPLDPADVAILNSRLRDFGFCVLVRRRDGVGAQDLDAMEKQYCHKSISEAKRTRLFKQVNAPPESLVSLPASLNDAILYRPTVAVDVYVMWQPKRRVATNWVIYKKRVMTVIDPDTIHSLDVRRAIFSTRATNIKFQDGVLTEIMIDKGSELEGFIKIPLNILRAVFSLPTELIAIQIGETNAMQDLIRTQAELAVAQTRLQQERAKLTEAQGAADTRNALAVGLRSGAVSLPQCVASCQGDGRDRISCEDSCFCLATQCDPGDIACQNACFN